MADKTEVIYDLIFNTQAASKDIASLNVQLKSVQDNVVRLSTSGRRASAAINDTGSSFGKAGQSIQNASYQLGDFAVQVGGGVDASRALAQQLPQLLGGMGLLGAGIGALVAITIPLAAAFGEARDYAKELEDGLDKLEAAQKISQQTLVALTEEYGKYATAVRTSAVAQEELARLEIERSLRDQAVALSELNSAYLGTAGAFGEVANQLSNFDFGRSAIAQLFQPLDEVSNRVNFLKDKFNLTETAARALNQPFQDFQTAVKNFNTDAASLALQQFAGWIAQNKNEAASALPLLQAMTAQFEALSKIRPIAQSQASSMGFSFTPITEATGYSNYEGEAKVAEQLAAIEKRVAEQKKAVADAARAAAAAQREQNSAYESFVGTIERGVTPLQRLQDTLRKAEENFAKFKDRMSAEEVAAYTAYIADLNTKIDELAFKDKWDKMAEGINSATEAMDPFSKAIQDVAQNIQDSFANGLADAFMAFIEGTKSAEEAFKQFATTFLKEITGMIIKSLILFAIQKALGMVGGGIGGGLGGLLGGAGIYAKGGVFSGGREVKAFASGGVINGPTLFPTSSGLGLMGEAGPEAIVPLTRRNGKLGVEASPVNVTVINNSSAQVSTRKNADGGVTIEVIEEAVASAISRGGNKIDQAMARGYGLRRAGR